MQIYLGEQPNDGTGDSLRVAGLKLNQTGIRKNNFGATSDPTANNDVEQGYEIGSRWVNASTREEFVCYSNTSGEAIWKTPTASFDELSVVAETGSYDDLTGKPLFGSAAYQSVDYFASAAQGEMADNSVQQDSDILKTVPFVTETSSSFTLGETASGKIVRRNSGSANESTIPSDATHTHPNGTILTVRQVGSGTTTVRAASGVTLNGVDGGSVELNGQFTEISVQKISENTWEAPNVTVT